MVVSLAKNQQNDLLTIPEVAKLVGASYPTVRRRIQSLGIPLYTRGTNGRTKLIKKEDVARIKAMGEEIHLWRGFTVVQ